MSGVMMDEQLFCAKCGKVTTHHTEWSSEEPNVIIAQCEHFGDRLVSFVKPSRESKIGRMIYVLV